MNKNLFYFLTFNLFVLNADPFLTTNFNNRRYPQDLVKGFITESIKVFLRSSYNKNNPYKNTDCLVRYSNDICDQEKDIIKLRLEKAKNNLENFVGFNLSKMPRIAICTSGGGYRAMIATIGALIGLNEINLLDSVLYSSSLSGSTWAIASTLSSNQDLNRLKEQLSKNLASNPKVGNKSFLPVIKNLTQIKTVINNLMTEYLFNQNLDVIDIYGALLANNIFTPLENRQNLKLSEQCASLKNGANIFPIYTAIEPTSIDFNYNWYELTPYEIGSTFHNCYIPIWGFGRKFNNGQPIACSTGLYSEFGPELSLGFFMGIFGSAFEINIEELHKMFGTENLNYVEKFVVKAIIDKFQSFAEQRFIPAKTFNFTRGMPNCINKDQDELLLMDAGIDFNLPFPPLLRKERKIDIIIVIDASSDLKGAPELQKAEIYALKNKLKFPLINYNDIEKKSLTTFIDNEDKEKPLIIYLPFVKDTNLKEINENPILKDFDPLKCIQEEFCGTFNCAYSVDEFNKINELMRFNIVQNKELIKSEIIKKIKLIN